MTTRRPPIAAVADRESVRKLMQETWPERHEDLVELKISLAVMAEQIRALTAQVSALTTLIETRKIPWWQFWGPVAFFLAASGGTYMRFDDKVRALELVDQTSISERRAIREEIRDIKGTMRP